MADVVTVPQQCEKCKAYLLPGETRCGLCEPSRGNWKGAIPKYRPPSYKQRHKRRESLPGQMRLFE
jgi:hypothetical protein